MQGARFILQSRFFHVAKPGEPISDYALSEDHVKALVEYCATRESVDYNLINESVELSATSRQKESINELIKAFEDNNISINFSEMDDYKSDSSRNNALKLINRMTEEILADNSLDESAQSAAQKGIETINFYDNTKRPATEKQINTINSLLKQINYKDNEDIPLEYDDYESAPTVQNASELISRLSEELLMKQGQVSNLVEYAAKRPGAVRVGEHGLFSSFENVDLEEAKEEVSKHKGNIWTHILSLRREDAGALGYDSQKPWRDLIMANIDTIAKAHNIKPENLRWYAAMHNTGHHPHIHLFVFSIDPNEGFYSEKANKSITLLKRTFVTQIFNDERYEILIDKDLYRDELKEQAEEKLDELLKNPNKYISDKNLNDLINKMLNLADNLPTHGKIEYGWSPKKVKELVNDIEKSLVNNNKQLSDLYNNWAKEKYNLHKFYVKDKLPDIPSIETVSDFTKIKNSILKQAENIRDGIINLEQPIDVVCNTSAASTIDDSTHTYASDIKNTLNADKVIPSPAPKENRDNIKVNEKSMNINTTKDSSVYTIDNLIDTYVPKIKNNSSTNNVLPSPAPKESRNNNLSHYDPVQKYMKQFPEHIFYSPEPDTPELREIFGSRLIFESDDESIKNFKSLSILATDLSSRNGEICRNLADCYNYGKGIEKDITQAVMWYGIAADQFQDSMASYRLGQLYLYGADGIDIDNELGHYYCNKAFYKFWDEIKNSTFFDDLNNGFNDLRYQTKVPKSDAYKEYLMGRMYLKGEGVEQDYFKSYQTFLLAAENGYAHANYYIGNQYYYGLGFNQDYSEALSYYQKASEANDSYADYRIAKMYIKGEGVNADIINAEKYLLKAINRVTLANYDLAELYENNPETFQKSSDTIYSLYQKALDELLQQEQNSHDAFTEIRIASMYLNGKGTNINIDEAVKWFEKSAEQGNPDAAYQLGYIYSSEKYALSDIAKSNKYYAAALSDYEKAEEENSNATAEYRIGLIYLNGLGVDKNIDKAVHWFSKSTSNGNASAAYKLAVLYDEGTEVTKNPEKAFLFYQLSSELGNPYANYKLGNISLENSDIPQAIKYFEQAADNNISHAWYRLGQIYSDTEYGVLDAEKANVCYGNALQQYISDYQENPDDFIAYRIGQMYFNAQGTVQDIPQSIAWFEKSAEQGNPDAAYQLGIIHSQPDSDFFDTNKANDYFSFALNSYLNSETEQKNSTTEYRLGKMFLSGQGTEKDIDKAVKWFEKALVNENINAAYQLGKIYYSGTDVPQNLRRAEEFFKMSAENNNPYACYYLGNISLENNDIPQAIKYFEQAADKNISHAWYRLGQIYSDTGYGVLDTEKANICYGNALQQYISDYQENPDDFTAYRIGQMYFNAQGTVQDISQSVAWFEKSAEQGNPDAAYQLGYIYKSENYGFKNDMLSNKYFSSALPAYQTEFSKNPTDSSLAMRIGTFYHYGLGVERDIDKAIFWYKKSVELGNQKAQQKIDEAQQIRQLSVMSIATTACHLGRMINTETMAAAKNRYVSDTKLLHKEKIQKIYAGHAISDYEQSYDY